MNGWINGDGGLRGAGEGKLSEMEVTKGDSNRRSEINDPSTVTS